MRTTRLIAAALAAALTTAALAGPTVALASDTHNQPHGSNARSSQGSLSSGDAQPSVTTLPGPPTWPANPQPIDRPHASSRLRTRASTGSRRASAPPPPGSSRSRSSASSACAAASHGPNR